VIREAIDPDHCGTALGELIERGTAHGAQPDDREIHAPAHG
jgi:hypothetical protein